MSRVSRLIDAPAGFCSTIKPEEPGAEAMERRQGMTKRSPLLPPQEDPAHVWHTATCSAASEFLRADPGQGLSQAKAASRLSLTGMNILEEEPDQPYGSTESERSSRIRPIPVRPWPLLRSHPEPPVPLRDCISAVHFLQSAAPVCTRLGAYRYHHDHRDPPFSDTLSHRFPHGRPMAALSCPGDYSVWCRGTA